MIKLFPERREEITAGQLVKVSSVREQYPILFEEQEVGDLIYKLFFFLEKLS